MKSENWTMEMICFLATCFRTTARRFLSIAPAGSRHFGFQDWW